MGLRIDPSAFPEPGCDEVVSRAEETRTVVLAGGLFWCADAIYRELRGVTSVRPGYAGGSKATANFEAVSGGRSEHAFAVELVYQPAVITLGQILRVFFAIVHDPTLPCSDRARRSAIYHTTPSQRSSALAYIRRLQQAGVYDSLILTEVEPLASFFEAEPLHHDYVAHHPRQQQVRLTSLPKLAKLRKLHAGLLKPAAAPGASGG